MHRKLKNMTSLELRHLERFCQKYDIDTQEIDNSLTYYENLQHLKELAKMLNPSCELAEIEQLTAQHEEFMSEHALTNYASYVFGDKTTAEIKAEQQQQRVSGPRQFSLKEMRHVGFSLRTFNQKG
jgi:predicted RNase H-like nuclease (RuvC/YqgF family)